MQHDQVVSYSFDSGVEGASVLILGAIHGNEKCGSNAIEKIIAQFNDGTLKPLKGKVTFVPICNPAAYKAHQRYMDVNLNRVMKLHDAPDNYEAHLANQIVPLIASHDFTLDLHSIHSKGASFAFLDYPNKMAADICDVLGVKTIFTGWVEMYEDTGDMTTLDCAHKSGKASVTVECGQHEDPDSVKVAEECILNTLQYFGTIAGLVSKTPDCQTVHAKHRIVKSSEGALRPLEHMSSVKSGEIIADLDNGEKIIAPEDGVVLIPFKEAQVGDEWLYLGQIIKAA